MDTDEDREAREERELDERVAQYLTRTIPDATHEELMRRARTAREMGFMGVGSTRQAGDHFTTADQS